MSSAIRIATLGDIDQNSARFSLSDRQIPIRVALSKSPRERLSTIQNLPVTTHSGDSVPLRVVADIGFGAGPPQPHRTNHPRQLTTCADLAPGTARAVALQDFHHLPLTNNYPLGVHAP